MAWAILACAAAVLLCACGPVEVPDWWPGRSPRLTIDAWAVNEMEKLTSLSPRRQDDLLVNPRTGCLELFAAANETVSFQVVVQADARPLRNVKVACGPLQAGRTALPREDLRVYRLVPTRVAEYPAWYVRLAESPPQQAEFYDAMVPAESPTGGQPFQVQAGGRLVLWVDLYVPRGTAPEEYAGEFTVTADDRQAWSAKVRVQVYDLVLPDARAIAAVGGFDHVRLLERLIRHEGKGFAPAYLDRRDPAVRRGLLVIRQLMQVGHDHRLDLFDTSLRPLLKREPSGEVRLDWADYDAIAQPYLDGSAFADRVGCPAWPSPFCESWPDPDHYGGADSPAYVQTAQAVLALCRDHFPDEDLRKRIFLWPSRGKEPPGGYEEFIRLARLIRSVDERTPILGELPASPPKALSWAVPADYRKLADILAPPGHWFDPRSGTRRAEANGPPVGPWMAPGYPPHFPGMGVLADPADLRAIPWVAMKYGCSGLLVPDVLDWDGPNRDEGQAGAYSGAAGGRPLQTTLFYPGTLAGIEGVLPSVRLKWLRRGLQDLAYLQILRQRGAYGVARNLLDAMVRYAGLEAAADHYLDARLDGWVKDPQVWITVRRILAEEARQAVNPTELSSRELLAQRLAWQELRRRTAAARIEQVRTKVTAIQHVSGREHFAATVLLDLYNEQDQPAGPTIRVGALPPGWESLDGGEIRVPEVPPNSRRTVAISLQGLEIPFSPVGKMEVPLTFLFPDGRQRKLPVPVPILRASPIAKPPRIDGLLVDWPIRPGNMAGDFALLGRRGLTEGGLARRQTQAFVLRDAENLYFGIRCREPNMAELVMRPDNLVRYDQLLACGEDLVEVLLDPGGKARGPEELYHILVKPNGIVVAERGIGSAGLGRGGEPWASGATSAVTRRAQEWIVELAVPLAAFAPEGRSQRFWGVNFARFAPRGQESSNWAQTSRYLYHPRNLGTMFVPPFAPATKETTNGK